MKKAKKQLLLHHRILEDRPQWKEMLKKSPVTPLAVEYEDKFILYQPDISVNSISTEDYECIIHQIEPCIQKWFH